MQNMFIKNFWKWFLNIPDLSSSKTALTQQLMPVFVFFKPFVILSDLFLTQPSE